MTALLRVEIDHHLRGAVAADKYVNVIYLQVADLSAAAAATNEIASLLFGTVTSIYKGFDGQVTAYDMAAPKPRPEVAVAPYAASSPLTLNGILPEQVALCLSYYATRNLARQRGRIYMGPFPVAEDSTGGTPPTDLINSLIAVATGLHTLTHSTHMIYSTKNATAMAATNYWVDNRWDTQRRRLPKPSARTTYP